MSGSNSDESDSGDEFGMQSWGVLLENNIDEHSTDAMSNFEKEFEAVWPEWVMFAHEINWKK